MNDASALLMLKRAEFWNRLVLLRSHSKFKILVLVVASIAFWYGLFRLFQGGLAFFRLHLEPLGPAYFHELVANLLYVFFLAMSAMLLISNAIISYSSFYRSRETAFLLSGPLRIENIFLYKFLESLGFSSWALVFLATPLLAAYGSMFHLSAAFYGLSFLFAATYLFIPAALGASISMIMTNYLPWVRRHIVPLLIGLLLIFAGALGAKILALKTQNPAEIRLMTEIFEELGFSRNPLLPSTWISRAILLLSEGPAKLPEALFFFATLAANAAFMVSLLYCLSRHWLLYGWFKAQGLRQAKKRSSRQILDWAIHRGLFFLTQEIRLILVKDLKSFIRDPVQWSQFMIFFGLLGIYFLNLRTFGYESRDLLWKLLISQMNLLATALTLSTFSSRFIYPQLSLEGRRYWIIGMAPMARDTILFGKLTVSFVSSVLISEALIGISSFMLSVPILFALTHAACMLGICLGLSGMAVGLGALYPNFREDNPSKIVAGFGGTLNLVLNLAFVLFCVLVQAAPFALLYTRRMPGMDQFRTNLILAMSVLTVVCLSACMIPMVLGLRAVRKMEI